MHFPFKICHFEHEFKSNIDTAILKHYSLHRHHSLNRMCEWVHVLNLSLDLKSTFLNIGQIQMFYLFVVQCIKKRNLFILHVKINHRFGWFLSLFLSLFFFSILKIINYPYFPISENIKIMITFSNKICCL